MFGNNNKLPYILLLGSTIYVKFKMNFTFIGFKRNVLNIFTQCALEIES